MKIANIILTSVNGGAEQVFIDYMIALKNLGHDISAIMKDDAPYENKARDLTDKITKTTNKLGFYDFIAVKNIKEHLEKFEVDVVFAHAGRAQELTRKAIRKIKNKKIFLISVNHSSNVKRSIGSDIILSVNRQIFFKTIDFGQPEDKSFVISNAIDLSDANLAAKAPDFKNKKEVIIGAIGRFQKCKGFDIAIKSLAIIQSKSDKKFILKIAGTGQEEENLKSLTSDLKLNDKVEFCGWIKDKKSFFESLDIFIMPSIDKEGETFGLVLLEAMKYGIPVISTNCDGPKEVLRDKIDGILIDLEPSQDLDNRLSAAILNIINNQEDADNFVKNSSNRVKEKFSFSALEKRLKEVV